ncbi:MAG: hypothetical protein KDD24_00400 [Flavobacteriales bacterium]|nr:hypothetical protein [Flavobacteriales bacterium]MCB9173448.1 hypothetical protein [Flavobacteriales bacterium]
MKKILITIKLTFITIALIAQPTDTEITNKLKAEGALEVKFFSAKGTVHTSLTEKWYERTAESKWKTNKEGVYTWSRSDYRYDYLAGKWSYTRSYFADSWYEGIPNPSEAEVLKIINDDIEKYMSGSGETIGKPESIKLADKPKWTWESLKKATCYTEAIYTVKIDQIGNAQKIKQIKTVSLYKDKEDKNAPFVRFISYNEGEPIVLENVSYEVENEQETE